MTLYLLTWGDGGDGDPPEVVGVFTTREKAEAYLAANHAAYAETSFLYLYGAVIEEWPADPVFDRETWR